MATTTKRITCRDQDAERLKIHTTVPSKYIPNPIGLSRILLEELGKGGFEVEMRHNIYNIKSKTELNPCTIEKIRELSRSLTTSI
ncbi:uncharacterized protein GGS22DRAFT_169009 [Annulohypoxylon maeteangense]|uniref:uncharacterized protein n=1 Tax=Annulohypoxylon maeteangense TaxID=1927788 RepID=UPI0020084A6A|nr:uncharacterized protein GGS22DRAFT_169009 [Annulohypoxylon maeteangense]KAI0882888.1 hypothetical protein GGS22DRAFT_169009 [Annulohypoxylon maeteangense]